MTLQPTKLRFVCFDADDTLWKNEEFYREAEQQFYTLLRSKLTDGQAADALFHTEMSNLPAFGYGAKGFTLSMIETALNTLDGEEAARAAREILQTGKALLLRPVEVFPGVKETLEKLTGKYHLAVVTKGDLWDQERKIKSSGLQSFFERVEIVSDKNPAVYGELFARIGARPDEVLMVGNSLKSDVFPALEVGAQAAYLPCPFTWRHEKQEEPVNPPYLQLSALPDLLEVLL